MEFLLECIGFPPDHDSESLARAAKELGETAVWRGPGGAHLRLPLGQGVEVRVDREDADAPWSVVPYFESARRVRVALERWGDLPDSKSDALLEGWANPPLPGKLAHPSMSPDSWPMSMIVTDARRLRTEFELGKILALSMAGFALCVDSIEAAGAHEESSRKSASIQLLGGSAAPGGCVELDAEVLCVNEWVNPLTARTVRLLELDVPGKPLEVFVSPWQLEQDGLAVPEPGSRIQGVFLLTGRSSGGLTSVSERLGRGFG